MRSAAAALAVTGASAVAVAPAGARPADYPPQAPAALHVATRVPAAPHTATRVVEVRAGGFDWGDAGLGAAGALSLLAVGAGAVVVTRRSRPRLS